jgi:hypothetical protein
MPAVSVSLLVGYLLSFLGAGALAFVNLFYLLSFGDVEESDLSPIDLCSRTNKMRLFEFGGQAVLMVVNLLLGQWFFFLCNVPIAAYNYMAWRKESYLLSPVDVYRKIDVWKRQTMWWIGGYAVLTFSYLIALVVYLLWH